MANANGTKPQPQPQTENLPQKVAPTLSERFTSKVIREYSGSTGLVEFGTYQKKLAQHLFVKVDMALKDAETRRLEKNPNGTPVTWANVNMEKLAVDAVHRIELGLDALIPNHLHPIPYFNTRMKKYDIDLRVGFAGKDYYYRKMALEEPVDIVYELVYENDEFIVNKKSYKNPVETYEFNVKDPFNRGKVVGGFAYIMYKEAAKNKLVIVTQADFDKAMKASGSNKFWGPHPDDMKWKTIVHRASKRIVLDPQKINGSFAAVERDDYHAEAEAQADVDQFANGDVIDIEPEPAPEPPKQQTRRSEVKPAPHDTFEEQDSGISEEEAAEIAAAEIAAAEMAEAQAYNDGPPF